MGFFSGYGGRHAMAGLGRIVNNKTGSLSKDARRVVSAFMRGEVAEGNCAKDAGCGIISYGDRLEVLSPDNDRANVHVLAKRAGGATAESMEVCIPAEADIEAGPLRPGQKRREGERSRDIRAASSALLQAVGAGIGVRTDAAEGKHYFSGSKGKSRIAVPGACVRVKFDKKQREFAALTMEGREKYYADKVKPTPAEYAKARTAVLAAKNEALAAKRKLALEQAARERPAKIAQKAIEKAQAAVQAAEKRLFAARERASAVELARNLTAQTPQFIRNPALPPLPASKTSSKPRKPRKPAAKKAPAKKAPAKKGGKKGKK
jgi:hypothetical protein